MQAEKRQIVGISRINYVKNYVVYAHSNRVPRIQISWNNLKIAVGCQPSVDSHVGDVISVAARDKEW